MLYATADHIATITLNRPARMNTISRAMLGELTERLLEADADRDVRVIVLTATGRAFCAGLDLTEVMRPSASGGIASGIERHRSRPAQHPAHRAVQPRQAHHLRPERLGGRLWHGHRPGL